MASIIPLSPIGIYKALPEISLGLQEIIRKCRFLFPNTYSIFEKLLQETQDLNVLSPEHGVSLLHYCVYFYGSGESLSNLDRIYKLIETLISRGANVELPDSFGRTPLYFSNSSQVIEVLIKAGAKIIPSNPQVAPLHVNTSLYRKCVNALCDRGADCYALDKYQRTPLHCAAMNNGFSNAQVLLRNAPLCTEMQDAFGHYPLFYAFLFGDDPLVELLIQHTSAYVIKIVLQKLEEEGVPDAEPENKVPFEGSILESMNDPRHTMATQQLFFINPAQSEIPPDRGKDYYKAYHIYDEIYNIHVRLRVMSGGGKNKARQKKALVEKAAEKKEKTYVMNSITYYLHPDKHGYKHINGSHHFDPSKKQEFIDNTRHNPAMFYPEYAKNYYQLLEEVIRFWADSNEPDWCFFKMPKPVGADAGQETQWVELYYGAEVGSHIRPKFFSVDPR